MSEYDFILDGMTYSFSSANSFNTCPYGFKLTYIDRKKREGNFFSDYGNLIHKIMELYFKDEIDVWDMAQYYRENYDVFITHAIPPYPKGMWEQYFQAGLEFFENFEFDKSKYDVVVIENSVDTTIGDIKLVVKPDLVLRDKITGKQYLFDYKTKKLKGNKYDEKSLEEYKKQFYLYSFFLWQAKGMKIDEIKVWFIRNNQIVDIPMDDYAIVEAIDWFKTTVSNIKNEAEWQPKLKGNEFFCKNLCSVSNDCRYFQEQGA